MEPYLGEIKLFPLTYAPQGWAICDGTLLPISSNQALFSLLRTYYGGDGKTNFALPDLRGRVPVGTGNTMPNPGFKGGEETVTLTEQQVPQHTHPVNVYPNAANKPAGLGNHIAAAVTNATPAQNINLYAPLGTNTIALAPATVDTQGAGAGHDNMQPWLALNYCIAISGLYPQHP